MDAAGDDRDTALITGAAGGIGRALVDEFERAGWRVVSVDRVPLERPGHVQADIADLVDPDLEAHRLLVDRLRAATGGRCKAVIANAAHQVVRPSAALSAQDWRRTLDVNLLSPFWLAMAFLDELEARRGSVLAISSIHERLTKPGFVAYATSKAALSGLVRSLAVDVGARIRVNALCPAAVATPMLVAGFDERPEALQALRAFHPAGRLGEPAEVARTALFLCSDQAGFIHGSCIGIDGGIGGRLHDPV